MGKSDYKNHRVDAQTMNIILFLKELQEQGITKDEPGLSI
jgi:hypothetical protein